MELHHSTTPIRQTVNVIYFHGLTACTSANVWQSEKETRISGISKKLESLPCDPWQTFSDLDGNVFFEDAIRNEDALDMSNNGKREEIVSALKAVQKVVGGKASPFYAMLMMDGDGIGALLSKKDDAQKKQISAALSIFGRAVPDVVKECDGRLIYCGGDDVFALLPMERALNCAQRCRGAYQSAFQEKAPFVDQKQATISAAILYAHIHVPLSVVVHQSHALLDEIAKDRTGRDAVACQVYKPGGITLTWAMPWEKMLKVQDIVVPTKTYPPSSLVDELLYRFQDNTDDPTQFSSKFFYRMDKTFELLADEDGKLISDLDAEKLLAAEYLSNRELKWPKDWSEEKKREEAELRVGRLLALCTEYRRTLNTDSNPIGESILPTGRVSTDGALLVRFLAQKGME